MSSLTHTPAAIEAKMPDALHVLALGAGPVKLRPTGDGWSLVGPDEEVLFHAPGIRGRRRCLEFARNEGVLAVFS
jgi:hypothetical protein